LVLLGDSAFDNFRFPVPVTLAVVAGAMPEGAVEIVGLTSLAVGGTTAGAMAGVLMGELVDAGLAEAFMRELFEGPDMALDECVA